MESITDPWGHVQFHSDGSKIAAPIQHFFDKVQVQKELGKGQTRKFYHVFWSPIKNDTPEKLEKREGKVSFQDEVKIH